MDNLNLIGRNHALFVEDMQHLEVEVSNLVSQSKFLIVGGAGSIGQALAHQIFLRNPKVLHIVDISENNMVELVRNLRSAVGYGSGDFKTFAVDCGSVEFDFLIEREGPYDYIFNLSALKHVRSEKDPYSLMRMVMVNILNSVKLANLSRKMQAKNFFCVSTDKAANPANMMGASKRIMELFLMRESLTQHISMARFANVAFSDGSLLHGFNQRFLKKQPISAPVDVRRYFITPQESGELCLLSGLFGSNRDIYFPKLDEGLHLLKFSEIAKSYLRANGYEPRECETEEIARQMANKLIRAGEWPCLFFTSDTTGEKQFEEFYTDKEQIDMSKYRSIGIIKNEPYFDDIALDNFSNTVSKMQKDKTWTKPNLVNLFLELLPDFEHLETGKYLDQRM